MDPLSLLQGGASLVSGVMSSLTSAANVKDQIAAQQNMLNQTEAYNSQQVQQQEAYQTTMSNTAYQRAANDMKAAGLNPMMMTGGGMNASTPSGASASVGTPSVPLGNKTSALSGLGSAMQSGLSAAVTAKTLDKMTDEIANLQAARGLTTAETDLTHERTSTQKEQTLKTANEAGILGNEMPVSRLKGLSADDVLSMPSWLRSSLNIAAFGGSKLDDTLSPITNSAGALRRFLPTRTTTERTNTDGSGSFEDRWSGVSN